MQINQLLKRKCALLNFQANFNDHNVTFRSIPPSVISICLLALDCSKDFLAEAHIALTLTKTMLNSPEHATGFIQERGMHRIMQFITGQFHKPQQGIVQHNRFKHRMPTSLAELVPTQIKIAALDILHIILSYSEGGKRFFEL